MMSAYSRPDHQLCDPAAMSTQPTPDEPRNVDEYLASRSEFARPLCEKLRDMIRKAAPGLEETLRWNAPAYKGRGLVCHFAGFTRHVSLFFFNGATLPDPDGLLMHGEDNASSRSIKFTSLAEIKPAQLSRLVKAAVAQDSSQEIAPQARAKRAEIPVHPEFAKALAANPQARRFFESLPPSARREYCEWIATAKQDATRLRRIEEAMVMLTEGRRRNDQYRSPKPSA